MRQSEFRKQLKDASDVELEAKLTNERKGLFDLRRKMAQKQLDNPQAITNSTKNVARILTEMRERQIKLSKGS